MTHSSAWPAATRWILRIAFAIRCYGMGKQYLWNEFETDSTVFSTLLFEWKYSESFAQRVDDAGMLAMVVAAAIVLLTSFLMHHRFARWLAGGALVFAITWELLLPLTQMIRGGEMLSQWSLAEHGLRIAVPVALLILSFSDRLQPTEWILRIAVAATFGIHGIKAWKAAPTFGDMIITSCLNLLDFWPKQSSVELILKVIGIADLMVAAMFFVCRWPQVALYASVWALITAYGRYTSSSFGWPETLLRAAHVGGPLVLYLQWRRNLTAGQNQTGSGHLHKDERLDDSND